MTARAGDFMPLSRQLFSRNIAEVLAKLIEQKRLSAKQASRRYGIDPATAENLRKGVCSLGTLLKVALVEGRDLWESLGDEIYGETWDATEERRLQQLISEAHDAQHRLVRLRARREALDAGSSDGTDVADRPSAAKRGGRHG